MELRHRAKGATKKSARGLDVALGPTIYSGERYSKMSERLRRQQKNPSDVADASAQRVRHPLQMPIAMLKASSC